MGDGKIHIRRELDAAQAYNRWYLTEYLRWNHENEPAGYYPLRQQWWNVVLPVPPHAAGFAIAWNLAEAGTRLNLHLYTGQQRTMPIATNAYTMRATKHK